MPAELHSLMSQALLEQNQNLSGKAAAAEAVVPVYPVHNYWAFWELYVPTHILSLYSLTQQTRNITDSVHLG